MSQLRSDAKQSLVYIPKTLPPERLEELQNVKIGCEKTYYKETSELMNEMRSIASLATDENVNRAKEIIDILYENQVIDRSYGIHEIIPMYFHKFVKLICQTILRLFSKQCVMRKLLTFISNYKID
jgi:hypothetical protein